MLIDEPLQHHVERSIVALCMDRRHGPHSVERVPVGIVHLLALEQQSVYEHA